MVKNIKWFILIPILLLFLISSYLLFDIRNGMMVASIAQNPYDFSYNSIKMLAKIHHGEKVDISENKLIYIPVQAITKENVDSVEADIEAKLDRLQTRGRLY